MDLQSGHFTPVASEQMVPEITAAQVTSGVIELTIAITIGSDFPRDTELSCGMNVDVTVQNQVDGALGKWLETASGAAKVRGTTATCTLVIPYSWILPTPTQSETRSLTGRFSVTATEPGLTPRILRSTNQPFLSTTIIPSNGATSIYHASATL